MHVDNALRNIVDSWGWWYMKPGVGLDPCGSFPTRCIWWFCGLMICSIAFIFQRTDFNYSVVLIGGTAFIQGSLNSIKTEKLFSCTVKHAQIQKWESSPVPGTQRQLSLVMSLKLLGGPLCPFPYSHRPDVTVKFPSFFRCGHYQSNITPRQFQLWVLSTREPDFPLIFPIQLHMPRCVHICYSSLSLHRREES